MHKVLNNVYYLDLGIQKKTKAEAAWGLFGYSGCSGKTITNINLKLWLFGEKYVAKKLI